MTKEQFLHMAFHLKNRKETLQLPEKSVKEYFNIVQTGAKKNIDSLIEKVEE